MDVPPLPSFSSSQQEVSTLLTLINMLVINPNWILWSEEEISLLENFVHKDVLDEGEAALDRLLHSNLLNLKSSMNLGKHKKKTINDSVVSEFDDIKSSESYLDDEEDGFETKKTTKKVVNIEKNSPTRNKRKHLNSDETTCSHKEENEYANEGKLQEAYNDEEELGYYTITMSEEAFLNHEREVFLRKEKEQKNSNDWQPAFEGERSSPLLATNPWPQDVQFQFSQEEDEYEENDEAYIETIGDEEYDDTFFQNNRKEGDEEDEEEEIEMPISKALTKLPSPINIKRKDESIKNKTNLGGFVEAMAAVLHASHGYEPNNQLEENIDSFNQPSSFTAAEGSEKALSSSTFDDFNNAKLSANDSKLDEEEENDAVELDRFMLQIIYEKHKTGFEENKDFHALPGELIAGKYQVLSIIGEAAFSITYKCQDITNEKDNLVCLKVIKNKKDFLDQGLDEIKLLMYINNSGDPDKFGVLRLLDYFYYKEHLFLVSELLRDNLYEFCKLNNESGDSKYFTIPRLRIITRQILNSLAFIHQLGLIHCDLKPENILISSYSSVQVKLIDFGSSCYTTDHLTTYIQSRSYRAPEVILGHAYDNKIDLWSLGCIIAELYTNAVLFENDSVQTLLARAIGILGPIPENLLLESKETSNFFTQDNKLFQYESDGTYSVFIPVMTSLKYWLNDCEDEEFVSFLALLLSWDPNKRPTAEEAMNHPFLHFREEDKEAIPYASKIFDNI